MKEVLLVDLGADYLRNSAAFATQLEKRGCKVYRPESLVEFALMIGMASLYEKGWVDSFHPDAILNLHFQNTPQVRNTLKVAEGFGTSVINPTRSVEACDNRPILLTSLRNVGVPVPDFYFGHPSKLPEFFGEEVVLKVPGSHLVTKVKTQGINSLEEVIYCERIIDNPESVVRTVYWISGCFFTVLKTDTLQVRQKKPKQLVANDEEELKMVAKILELTNLHFFNVEFIEGHVIDINAFPNFFFHKAAVNALVDHIVAGSNRTQK